MDKEKAADLLDNLIGMVEDNHEADYDTALRMGIEALRAGDTIYRQAAIDALGDEPEVWTGKDEYAMGLNNQWHYDRNAIKAVPSAPSEIIRCKDCTRYEKKRGCNLVEGLNIATENCFCSYAERRIKHEKRSYQGQDQPHVHQAHREGGVL